MKNLRNVAPRQKVNFKVEYLKLMHPKKLSLILNIFSENKSEEMTKRDSMIEQCTKGNSYSFFMLNKMYT